MNHNQNCLIINCEPVPNIYENEKRKKKPLRIINCVRTLILKMLVPEKGNGSKLFDFDLLDTMCQMLQREITVLE